MKTSELAGAALDWAVATASGLQIIQIKNGFVYVPKYPTIGGTRYTPTNDWAQGGPIIEREKIRLDTTWDQEDGHWSARIDSVGGWWLGETPLIAAMRCYVASKLGDDIEIPKELAK